MQDAEGAQTVIIVPCILEAYSTAGENRYMNKYLQEIIAKREQLAEHCGRLHRGSDIRSGS